jgi:hypothetical protein
MEHIPKGLSGKAIASDAVIQDIAALGNSDLREIVDATQILKEGFVIEPEDFSAIKTRAIVLARENGAARDSVEHLVTSAFIDRMNFLKKLGGLAFESAPVAVIQAALFRVTHYHATEEEAELFRRRSATMTIDEWVAERKKAVAQLHDFDIATNADSVVGRGDTKYQAAKDARA